MKKKDIEKFTIICSTNKKIKEVPVDTLKSIYVTSEESIENLARRYGLSRTIIENHIRDGNWEDLRKENREKSLQSLTGEVTDLLEDLVDIQKQALRLKTIELREKIDDTARYLVEKGSLKATNVSDGSDMIDSLGQAVYIKLPGQVKDLMEIQQSVTILAGLIKGIKNMIEDEKVKKIESEEKEEELTADKLLEYQEKKE